MDRGYLDMELLRFSTAGSVDDGKSTLIGRLLYDSKSIFEDQLEAVEAASKSRGNEEVNLALLTDGLRAEREQGITIDVAYRYFATPKRKFIIADTPGHIQYTRNMVTGASTADLSIILIDARHGVLEQTVRHSYISSLLGIPHILVAINKMDLVDFSKDVYDKIVADYKKMSEALDIKNVVFIPISAKDGDNVVNKSDKTPWYEGPTLLNYLETVPVGHKTVSDFFRFPVQYVIRPISSQFPDYHGYAGRVSGGIIRPGDKIRVLPSGTESTVKSIDFVEEHLEEAYAPMSITYDTLFGIPSIVYGSFAFTLMVWLGISASLGGGILVTTLLIVPILIRSMDEVAKTIPQEILDSSYSLGATRIETIGVVLRQIAAASLPLSVFFQLSAPQEDVQNRAYAAAVVLTIIVLVLSFGGRFIMSHFSKNKI